MDIEPFGYCYDCDKSILNDEDIKLIKIPLIGFRTLCNDCYNVRQEKGIKYKEGDK